MTISPIRTGIALGVFLGLWHAGWATLVALGFAQDFIEWIFRMHFLDVAIIVQPFDINRAYMLVSATMLIGFVTGTLIAVLWNTVRDRHARRGARAAV